MKTYLVPGDYGTVTDLIKANFNAGSTLCLLQSSISKNIYFRTDNPYIEKSFVEKTNAAEVEFTPNLITDRYAAFGDRSLFY